jgi:hypothetical protein
VAYPYDGMFYPTLPQDTQDFGQVLSGVGRSLREIGRSTQYLPYDVLGAPVDLATLAMRPMGYTTERPVGGSDWLIELARQYGLADRPTGSGIETATRLATGITSPTAVPRAVGKFAQGLERASDITTEQANRAADALVRQITGNPTATAPQVLQETSMPFMQAVAPKAPGLPQSARESFVPGVEAGKELIVHHNITPQKLAKVEKVGGMPVPSIAISNVENPLSGFGEISLIGNPGMANPSAKNPVFGFDAYTSRAPSISYRIDDKSVKNLKEVFSDVKGDLSDYDAERGVSRLVDNWDDRSYSEIMKVKFLKEKGILPNKEDFPEKYRYSQAIEDSVYNLRPEYNNWLDDFDRKLPGLGVNVEERIFKGFTDSGNRRYAAVTLENLVKEMKGGAGSEGFNYGIGNLRAVATPKFRKLDDIKASREKIVPSEEFKRVKEDINDAYDSLTERIGKLDDQKGYGYRPEDVLYDIGQGRNVNLLDRFKSGADDNLKADIGIFIRKLQQLPTEYFEIKPQRAVSVSEFQGAIVPSDVPQKSVDYLRSQGINDIYYYSSPEERKELFKNFGNQMFGAAPALPALGLLGGEEE